MPYIEQANRPRVEEDGPDFTQAGEVNYQVTLWLTHNLPPSLFRPSLRKLFDSMWAKSPRYATVNIFYGAVVLAFREYYRRTGQPSVLMEAAFQVMDEIYADVVGPYEDSKIRENGDVEGYKGVGK